MQSSSSAAPAPEPAGGAHAAPKIATPGPSIVPPKAAPPRRIALWTVILAVVVVGGGAAWYWNSNAQTKTGNQGIISVPTLAVSLGNMNATIRVNGTVAAQNFVSLLAPRIMGSRGGLNRGGDSNFGGGGGGGGQGGPGGADFNLVLLRLAKAGAHVKTGDVVGEFDPTNQLQRLDDYKDTVIQLENSIKKM